MDPLDKWGRWLCSCRYGHQSRCYSHSILLSVMMWPEECHLVFSDEGALLPPRRKHNRRKDGSFRSDKSKDKLKSSICFAVDFVDAPNFNDLPENPAEPLDKHLALETMPSQIQALILLRLSPPWYLPIARKKRRLPTKPPDCRRNTYRKSAERNGSRP